MSLLLLFAYTPAALSVPISELITSAPLPGAGYPVDNRDASAGEWRFAVELADPFAGASIVWHDITRFYAGDSYQRGADEYLGRYRAAVAQVQLQTDNDDLAPWGQDTSALFGVNVTLDAGLLMRAAMFRVDASVTVEWVPLWTGRVETWGDASGARGQIRTHVVTVTDTIADLANLPTIVDVGIGLSYADFLTVNASWLFGVDVYGDTDLVIPFDLNPVNAINRMDQAADPFGQVWRSRRDGRLIVYPPPWDTTNVDRWPNPLLDVYPSGLVFSYSPDFTDIEYIADDDAQPFGVQRTALGVLNSFTVTTPSTQFVVDDPVSQAHYGVRPFVTSWVAEGAEQVVDDWLTSRAYASAQALPLRTTLDHEGFWSAMSLIDHLDPVTIIHATSDDGLVVTAVGTVRNVTEDRTVRGDGTLTWQSTVQIDITSDETSPALLPVEDLAFLGGNSPILGGPSSATFSWTNPTQPDITPTEVQLRVLGRSLIWNPKTYPGVGADGTTIGFLSAATTYTLQVRLVRRVAGLIVAFSASRQVTFTTPALIYPQFVPDGDSTDVTVGEPPDFTDDCVLEVDLQANDGTGWVTVDSFTQSDLVQNPDGTWSLIYPIDNTFFNAASIYRFRSREVCSGVPGPWFTGSSFDPPDDWTDPCVDPPELSVTPYTDATLLVYVPKVCQGDDIVEAVSGVTGVKGDAFDGFVQMLGQPDRLALLAVDDPGWSDAPAGILAYGECDQINGETGSKTIGAFVDPANNDAVVLFECANMQITASPGTGTDWIAGATVVTPSGVISLVSGNLPVGTSAHVAATYNATTGEFLLYVDGTAVDTDTFGGAVLTSVALPIWRVGAPPASWVTDCALWSRVLAASELPGYNPLGLHAAIQSLSPLSHWPLRETAGTILDDIGSLNNDATGVNGVLLNQITAPDGFPAPIWTNISTSGGSAPDQTSYTPSTALGLTVVMAVRPTNVANSGVFISKRADGGGNGEWEVATSASGKVTAATFVSGTTAARAVQTNSVVLATTTWCLIIARFSGSTTGYPDLRINGVAVGQTQSSSGTANGNDTGKLQIGRRNLNSTQFQGAQAQVAIFSGQLSDFDCGIIEAASDAEGWY